MCIKPLDKTCVFIYLLPYVLLQSFIVGFLLSKVKVNYFNSWRMLCSLHFFLSHTPLIFSFKSPTLHHNFNPYFIIQKKHQWLCLSTCAFLTLDNWRYTIEIWNRTFKEIIEVSFINQFLNPKIQYKMYFVFMWIL